MRTRLAVLLTSLLLLAGCGSSTSSGSSGGGGSGAGGGTAGPPTDTGGTTGAGLPDPGCPDSWPHRMAVTTDSAAEKPYLSAVVACSDDPSTALWLNNGSDAAW